MYVQNGGNGVQKCKSGILKPQIDPSLEYLEYSRENKPNNEKSNTASYFQVRSGILVHNLMGFN